jgi:hypothetical protein
MAYAQHLEEVERLVRQVSQALADLDRRALGGRRSRKRRRHRQSGAIAK